MASNPLTSAAQAVASGADAELIAETQAKGTNADTAADRANAAADAYDAEAADLAANATAITNLLTDTRNLAQQSAGNVVLTSGTATNAPSARRSQQLAAQSADLVEGLVGGGVVLNSDVLFKTTAHVITREVNLSQGVGAYQMVADDPGASASNADALAHVLSTYRLAILPEGVYDLPGGINVAEEGRQLRGEGSVSVLRSAAVHASGLLSVTGANFYAADLALRGTNQNLAPGGSPDRLIVLDYDAHGAVIERVAASEATILIQGNGCSNLTLRDLALSRSRTRTDASEGYAILLNSGVDGFLVQNVRCTEGQRHDLYISSGSKNGRVEHFYSENCGGNAIALFSYYNQAAVENVELHDCHARGAGGLVSSGQGRGIGVLQKCRSILFFRCSTEGTVSHGIWGEGSHAFGADGRPQNIRAIECRTGATEDGSGGNGFWFTGCDDLALRSCEADGADAANFFITHPDTGQSANIDLHDLRSTNAGSYDLILAGLNTTGVRLGRHRFAGGASGKYNITTDVAADLSYDLPTKALDFGKTALTASMAAVVMDAEGIFDAHALTRAHYAARLNVRLSGAISAGTATVQIMNDGVAYPALQVVLGSSTTSAFGVQATADAPYGLITTRFEAGERIQLAVTTSADYAANASRDMTATLELVEAC